MAHHSTSPETSSTASLNDQLVSISEAAKMVGKGSTTIRRLIDKGLLEVQRDSNGWYWISRTNLLATFATKGLQATHRKVSGASAKAEQSPSAALPPLAMEGQLNALREQVEIIKEALHHERLVSERYRIQIERFEHERTQHMAEMRALLSKDVKAADGVLSRWLRR